MARETQTQRLAQEGNALLRSTQLVGELARINQPQCPPPRIGRQLGSSNDGSKGGVDATTSQGTARECLKSLSDSLVR